MQGFIFNWKGQFENARRLERALAPLVDLRILNSDDTVRGTGPSWVDLGEDAYFSAQWNAALRLFEGDVLFHIQADARFDEFPRLFARARAAFDAGHTGIFEPNIDYCSPTYVRGLLREVAPDLCAVPATDCTCWFVDAAIVRKFPQIDVAVNKYGWGVAATAAALCRRIGKLCVRDYSLLVHHPRTRGYSSRAAASGRTTYINSLDVDLALELLQVYLDVSKLKVLRGGGPGTP